MSLSFGEVLSRAWQITWKHKILWLSGMIITLIGFLSLPVSLIFNSPSSFMASDLTAANERMGNMLLANGLIFLISIVSTPIYIIGLSMPSLATRHLEAGQDTLSFRGLIRDSLPYFWRVLGIFLLVWVGMFGFTFVFLGCITLLSMVTMGIGALCVFPLVLLFMPMAIAVYSILELGMNAILVDDLGVSTAMRRAWDLLKQNPGTIVLISIVIYLGSLAVSMLISVPMMIPMFASMSNLSVEPDVQIFDNMFRSMMLWMLAFSPFYAVLQGILFTFMQSVWTLTYIRLRKSQDNTPVIVGAVA